MWKAIASKKRKGMIFRIGMSDGFSTAHAVASHAERQGIQIN
jgi:hypothetical protein